MSKSREHLPKAIDLFAGAGGLSLGAARAGLRVAAAVEWDKHAMATHTKNFPESKHICQDVGAMTGDSLLQLAGLRVGELDALIGGPPCQGFSTMGLRDVADDRNNLFAHFFRLVRESRPGFFIAENVPGILHEQYDDVRSKALELVPKDYVMFDPIRVEANLYGAATSRTRIFFIGYMPSRVNGSLTAASFAPPPDVEKATVGRALHGLPTRIDARWQSEPLSWRTAATCQGDYLSTRISGLVPDGVGDKSSLERFFNKSEVSGFLGTRHSEEIRKRYRALKYGETDATSKARKLDPDGYCPTIRAGTGSDKGSHQAVRPVHFDSPRVITPREAARLQGFPDWFVFHPTKWHSFRQIGNSVSPIVAERILRPLIGALS